MTKRTRRHNKGFTLIEILVSIMILAVSMTVLLQLFSGGLRAGRVSDEYTRAVFYAREKMEELLLLKELSDGEVSGEFSDGYSWAASTRYLGDEEETGYAFQSALDLFEIKVDVMWMEGGREKRFDISTITIAEKAAEK